MLFTQNLAHVDGVVSEVRAQDRGLSSVTTAYRSESPNTTLGHNPPSLLLAPHAPHQSRSLSEKAKCLESLRISEYQGDNIEGRLPVAASPKGVNLPSLPRYHIAIWPSARCHAPRAMT